MDRKTSSSNVLNKKIRCDDKLHIQIKRVTESNAFNGVIIFIILLNSVFITLEISKPENEFTSQELLLFHIIDRIFLTIYTLEFILKIYAEPNNYWKSAYNLFDFVVLAISYIQIIMKEIRGADENDQLGALKVFRALRALRTLRTVSFIKGLQVLVTALVNTIRKWVTNLIILLLLLMFLFAVMGYYLFSHEDPSHWATLELAMLTLLTFVTLDSWTDIQHHIDSNPFSKVYTCLFIILGHFIFYNVFIGVIIMNISEATESYKNEQLREREAVIKHKKEFMMMRQHNDVKNMQERMKRGNYSNFHDMVQEFQRSLRHDDSAMMSDLSTNLIWIETYMTMLDHMDASVYRVQQLHFEMANHLASVVEARLRKKIGA